MDPIVKHLVRERIYDEKDPSRIIMLQACKMLVAIVTINPSRLALPGLIALPKKLN